MYYHDWLNEESEPSSLPLSNESVRGKPSIAMKLHQLETLMRAGGWQDPAIDRVLADLRRHLVDADNVNG